MEEVSPRKSLGQHWLRDADVLNAVADASEIGPGDTVLEIGPGEGSLTTQLLSRGAHVIAVEKDERLAQSLTNLQIAENLQIVSGDILQFDLNTLPAGYKVAANIPYYLTGSLLRTLCAASNPFSQAAIVVQREVAQRVAAKPGDMSLLSVTVQFYADVSLGQVVPAEKFTPPPKVDSQILILSHHGPLFPDVDPQRFFQLAKAGFSERRKKLRSSLSGGLQISKEAATELLDKAELNPDTRAQELSLQNWYSLYKIYS